MEYLAMILLIVVLIGCSRTTEEAEIPATSKNPNQPRTRWNHPIPQPKSEVNRFAPLYNFMPSVLRNNFSNNPERVNYTYSSSSSFSYSSDDNLKNVNQGQAPQGNPTVLEASQSSDTIHEPTVNQQSFEKPFISVTARPHAGFGVREPPCWNRNCVNRFPSVANSNTTPRDETAMIRLINAINHFAFDLYQKLEQNNNFFSPFSISTMMAMVVEGAANETLNQLMSGLQYSRYNLTPEEVKSGFKHLLLSLRSNSRSYTLQNGNLVLLKEGFLLNSNYMRTLRNDYKASLILLNFSMNSLQTKQYVNNWVAQLTQGMITELLPEPLEPSTVLTLLNAVYFKGKWENSFDKSMSRPGTFYNNGKIPVQVTMMTQNSLMLVAGFDRSLGVQIVELPYLGDVSMLIVLPFERDGITSLKAQLTYNKLNTALDDLPTQSVRVTLPQFTFRQRIDLRSIFKSMGMEQIFDIKEADFGKITHRSGLHISDIFHTGAIEVNEEGTEAAGGGGVSFVPLSLPYEMNVNHPFLYFIRDRRSKLILFMGQFDRFSQ